MTQPILLIILVVIGVFYLSALQYAVGALENTAWYTALAYSLLYVGVSSALYVGSLKYLSLWNSTGGLRILALVARLLLPVLACSWFVKYQVWILFETWFVGLLFIVLVSLMWIFHSPILRYVDEKWPLSKTDLVLLGGRLPKKRSEMLFMDLLCWATFAAPLIIFHESSGALFF